MTFLINQGFKSNLASIYPRNSNLNNNSNTLAEYIPQEECDREASPSHKFIAVSLIRIHQREVSSSLYLLHFHLLTQFLHYYFSMFCFVSWSKVLQFSEFFGVMKDHILANATRFIIYIFICNISNMFQSLDFQ